jgi:hypothetical protein
MGKKGKSGKGGGGSANSNTTMIVAAAVAVVSVGAFFALGGGDADAGSSRSDGGSGGRYKKGYDHDPHDLKNFKVPGREDLKTPETPTAHMKRAGSEVWSEARKKLLANPNAIQIGVNPEIFVIPNFLSDEECDEVLELHAKRREEATKTPKWCFSTNYHRLIPKGTELEAGDMSDKCMRNNVALGQSIADQRERSNAFSRSVMVAKGEYDNTIIDKVGLRVDEQAMRYDHGVHLV